MRKEVMSFALTMEEKLCMHDEQRGPTGWKNEPVDYLLNRLSEEVAELRKAIADGASLNTINLEAADVGNLAMMVADAHTYQTLPPAGRAALVKAEEVEDGGRK